MRLFLILALLVIPSAGFTAGTENLIIVKIGEKNMETKAHCAKFKGDIVLVKKVPHCRFAADGVVFVVDHNSSRSNVSQ